MSDLKFRFNEALEFPCDQHMRIIVDNKDDEPQALIDAVNKILPKATDTDGVIDSRVSKSNTYISYTLRVRFNSAKEMETLYAELVKNSFVKHIL